MGRNFFCALCKKKTHNNASAILGGKYVLILVFPLQKYENLAIVVCTESGSKKTRDTLKTEILTAAGLFYRPDIMKFPLTG